jgi:short-subunit dehydrogenase
MQVIKKGHLVFLSLINGSTDYSHHHFVQGFFESMLADNRGMRTRGGRVDMTQVNVHRKLLTDSSTDYMKFGIFGTAEASSVAKKIIRRVRQKRLLVTMPPYMAHVPKFLRLVPRKIADNIVDLMYRVY